MQFLNIVCKLAQYYYTNKMLFPTVQFMQLTYLLLKIKKGALFLLHSVLVSVCDLNEYVANFLHHFEFIFKSLDLISVFGRLQFSLPEFFLQTFHLLR